MIEKPSRQEAKSNLAMFGRFLLSPEVIKILSEIPLGKANELWLTDSVREYIRRGRRVVAQKVEDGEWLTIGDPVNYASRLEGANKNYGSGIMLGEDTAKAIANGGFVIRKLDQKRTKTVFQHRQP